MVRFLATLLASACNTSVCHDTRQKSTILESTPRLNVISVKKTFNLEHVIFAIEFRDNVSTAVHNVLWTPVIKFLLQYIYGGLSCCDADIISLRYYGTYANANK